MASLAAAYKTADPMVSEFFQALPGRLLDSPPAPGAWASGLSKAIREYNAGLGAEKSFTGKEAVVVTGQQPGLFTGPLYTILKAVTAIQLAGHLKERHGVPCVPVFWVGSEDHDFDEVRSAHVLTKEHAHLTLTYSPAADVAGMPMYRVPAEPALHGLVERLAAEAPGSEWREQIETFLHESLDLADSFAGWTARLLARLFRETPLVLFAPHLPAARKAGATIIRREIDTPLHSTAILNEQGARLDELGYPPQVVKGSAECNFFVEVDQRRRKVTWQDDHFVLPELGKHFSQGDLRGLLEAAPERFSPNVVLRPVVQQALFPAAAYVAGPGEIAYWAQLKPVFEHFGKTMPCVYPRADAALTSIKLNKIQRKLELVTDDLLEPGDQIEDRALRSLPPHPALPALARHRAVLLEQMATLIGELEGTTRKREPWQDMLPNLVEQLQQMLDRLERIILHNDEAQVEATRRQIERLCTALAPDRKPQDRVYCIFSWVFAQGWDLIPRLVRELDLDYDRRQEIEL